MKRVLITGMAGFVGHHVCEGLLKNTDWELIGLDRIDSAGNVNRFAELDVFKANMHRVKFIWHDLRSEFNEFIRHSLGKIDYIIHMGAASHVDRSIVDPMSFVLDNVVGVTNLLNYARTLDSLEKVNIFSTDEVFGPAPEGVFYKENDRHNPGNPYSGTKAAADDIALAFQNTYRLPIYITHCMNIFGERQHPEKFFPLVIKKVLKRETVYIHADRTKTKAGTRFYIHARNVEAAIRFLLDKAVPGEKYNIVGEREIDNLSLAQMISRVMNMPLQYELVDFHSSRPGHDLRYALDGKKLANMGWSIPVAFEKSLERTINWSLEHKDWLLL
jgi:dTDP-glucose 4,6-dehydratase